jgi:DNA adenine methylase
MKKPFGRVGSKTRLAKYLISLFPKYNIYIEPFFGGGGVYWKKPIDNIEIINDIDKGLMRAYRTLKKGINFDIDKYNTINLTELQVHFDKIIKTDKDNLIKEFLKNLTFGSMGTGKLMRQTNIYNKLILKDKYKERLKNTLILSDDWKNVIKKYDNKEAFIYLDPPYEKSKGLYEDYTIDFQDMSNTLKKIKGKFMLSINKSPYIKKSLSRV